jgi:hypothetical protein
VQRVWLLLGGVVTAGVLLWPAAGAAARRASLRAQAPAPASLAPGGSIAWRPEGRKAQARVSPQGLADALVAAGAVRAMQMDINPDWISFAIYEPNPDGSPRGARVMGTGGPGGLWLTPYPRDFFAVLIKPAVFTGGKGTVGAAPVNATAKVKVK